MFVIANEKKLFYGWVILAACFAVTAFAYGLQYSFGVFLKPLQDDLGWTRSMISWVPALFMACICIFGLLGGWLTDRFSPKIIVGIGGFFTGLGLALTSYVTAPWQLYIYYSLLVGFGTGCAGPPIFTTVSRWFVKRRGLALGIVATGIGLGTVIVAPVARWLISEYGWRVSFRVMGAAAVVIIVAAMFLRRPSTGATAAQEDDGQHETGALSPQMLGLTLLQALRTHTLWLLTLLHVFAYAGLLMVMYHLVAYAQDKGIAEMTAATLMSVIGGVSILGRLVGGIASDKLGRKPVFVVCLLLQAAMMLWLARSTSLWALYTIASLWGFGYGGWAPLMPALTAELFGLREMGSILGVVSTSFGIGGVLGPAIAGNTFTEADSYSTAFLIGGVMMILGAVIIPLLKRPRVA